MRPGGRKSGHKAGFSAGLNWIFLQKNPMNAGGALLDVLHRPKNGRTWKHESELWLQELSRLTDLMQGGLWHFFLFPLEKKYAIIILIIQKYRRVLMKPRRVLLKLSGEALAGPNKTGFDEETVKEVARQVKISVDAGVEVGIVIGGGNFWRGRTSNAIDRTKADQIGMLATVMNCIYVSEIFRNAGMKTQILTPFECGSMTKLFSKDRANKYFEKGMVVFFAGGTGHPYFSTDMATVLRAIEIEADVILSAKSIDGVYDSDPAVNPDAKKFDEISIEDVVNSRLPMMIFGLNEENSIVNTVNGVTKGTLVTA